jgi:hypothetical protein
LPKSRGAGDRGSHGRRWRGWRQHAGTTGSADGPDYTQENPGDAVIASGPLGAGVTLVKIFLKLVGSSGDPVQVAAAATLPTAITGIAPGDYEFTPR